MVGVFIHKQILNNTMCQVQFYFLLFFEFLKYCCSIRVVPPFPPLLTQLYPPSLPQSITPLPVPMNSFASLFLPFPPLSSSPHLQSLSVCSLFPSLWFYFAHLFVLLIRFHFVRPSGVWLFIPLEHCSEFRFPNINYF